jgi:hypothetical protein
MTDLEYRKSSYFKAYMTIFIENKLLFSINIGQHPANHPNLHVHNTSVGSPTTAVRATPSIPLGITATLPRPFQQLLQPLLILQLELSSLEQMLVSSFQCTLPSTTMHLLAMDMHLPFLFCHVYLRIKELGSFDSSKLYWNYGRPAKCQNHLINDYIFGLDVAFGCSTAA